MAQVTVQQLAEVVGASADRLLMQMKEAGLPHSAAEEAVSDEDKQTLLAFLKRSHGESEAAPRRITLKRKTISTLRTSGSQGRKTVNVEVRKKRTYVKRDPNQVAAEALAEEQDDSLSQDPAIAEAALTAEPVEQPAAEDQVVADAEIPSAAAAAERDSASLRLITQSQGSGQRLGVFTRRWKTPIGS